MYLSKKLTIKQKKFADEYIISGNATQAAIEAGYSKNTAINAHKNILAKPNVKAYIDERMQQLEDESIADQTEILQYLTRVIRDEETEEVLVNIGNMEQEIRAVKLSAKDKIKAAELLGKRWGSWTDKVDINSSEGIKIIDDIG